MLLVPNRPDPLSLSVSTYGETPPLQIQNRTRSKQTRVLPPQSESPLSPPTPNSSILSTFHLGSQPSPSQAGPSSPFPPSLSPRFRPSFSAVTPFVSFPSNHHR